MELKEACDITKPFTLKGREFIPAISDDWEFSISPSYVAFDKIILKSEKLSIEITTSLDSYSFFNYLVSDGTVKISQNKLIGEYSFSKSFIYTKESFDEATDIIELNDLEVIPNNELIDYGVYLDKKGDKYLYLGHYKYTTFTTDNNLIQRSSFSPDKKYILNVNSYVDHSSKIIQKNSNQKFISFERILSSDEINELHKDLFEHLFYGVAILSKFGGNELFTIKNRVSSSAIINGFSGNIYFCFINNVFGYLSRVHFTGEQVFQKIDFDLLTNDIKNDSLSSSTLNEYALGDSRIISFNENDVVDSIYFFLDYI